LFVGAVGCDAFASVAREFYRAEKIAARFAEKPLHATGTAGILVDAVGQNQIIVALSANAVLTPRDVPAALFRRARVVVCQHETNLAVNAHIFGLARRTGAITVLNPAPMRADFDPHILKLTDVLLPNESEFDTLLRQLGLVSRKSPSAVALAAQAPGRLHKLCRRLGVPTVIVTLGTHGCFVSEANRFTALRAHRVKVVDTTGAGDAFAGGFAAGLVKFDGDQLAAARFANSVAALSVTKFGTAPAMPAAHAIAKFLRAH
jgi:ribokinase